MIDKIFKLKENQTTLRREVIGGITTFMAMSYIIFVQPVVLSACGMDKGAVTIATCIAAAAGTLFMAFLANYPIALSPAMGHNFYFAYVVCLAMGVPWQTALGANFISGAAFIVLALFGLREKLINSVPQSLKNAIAVGIGLLIALIGLEWSGIIVRVEGTLIGLGDLKNAPVLLSLAGILLISILLVLRIKGAILLGILASTLIALITGMSQYRGIAGTPPSISPTLFKLDIAGALSWEMLGVIFTLFFLDLFDTVGTLIGISEEAGFIKDGKLPRAKGALLSDALATLGGTTLGTSTVTSYIESSTGVAEGARTGLANVVTALLFILALFFYPLIQMVSAGYESSGITLYPIIAPALIIVGVLMMGGIRKIDWSDFSESIPAFLTITIMSFSFSITEGISFGFISYTLLKTVSRKSGQVPLLLKVFSILFVLRYIFLK
ncbi:MAG: NCS2 family permease [Candidatus Omnitrophica bacterium]|nr:NCS2 family permease [Candidatus Omnitrophota bacterium]MBD3268895.1 NCS2 family permease [Candidatus Omnitrophota bacterium]